jgi:glyoxylase-like metal-dependent hydrolase (beta-lactamase superfamily II)
MFPPLFSFACSHAEFLGQLSEMSLPSHLAGTEPAGLVANELIAQYGLGPLRNFVYLAIDWKSGSAAIVDPQSELDGILGDLQRHALKLEAIFLTHTHHDHIAGVPRLLAEFRSLPLYGHPKDLRRLDAKTRARAKDLKDGDVIPVGGLEIRALHTPGHSAGELSYLIEKPARSIFTGDTVFIRDCGRTDFESGSNEQMFESIQKIKKLPPDTVILPGHHYVRECATTVAQELLESPPFRCKTVKELAELP